MPLATGSPWSGMRDEPGERALDGVGRAYIRARRGSGTFEAGRGLQAATGFGHPDVLQAPLGFLLQTLGQLVQDVARLVNPAALLAGAWVDLAERPSAPSPSASCGPISRPRRLRSSRTSRPGLLTFAIAVGDGDQFLLSLVRGPDDHQDALLLFLHAGAEIDAVHPEIDVALGRDRAVAKPPRPLSAGFVEAESRRGAPQERRQGFPEVAGGNALQIQPWQKVFQR